jgi:hypothetical protein
VYAQLYASHFKAGVRQNKKNIYSLLEKMPGVGYLYNQDTDITKNIRVIEFLKSELLTGVAALYQNLIKGTKVGQEVLVEILANLILVTYLLGKRLGFSFAVIDSKIMEKIRIGMIEDHETEKWYGDLSDLSDYMDRSRK